MSDHTAPDYTCPSRSSDAELEAQADALLWGGPQEPRRLEYSFFHETALRRLERAEHRPQEAPPPDLSLVRDTPAELLALLIRDANLSVRLRGVMALARCGLSDRQIGECLGLPRRRVHRWRKRAIALLRGHVARLREQPQVSPDLERVFMEQRRVSLYQPECHCAPGREACRRDGVCRHRWYLFVEEDRES